MLRKIIFSALLISTVRALPQATGDDGVRQASSQATHARPVSVVPSGVIDGVNEAFLLRSIPFPGSAFRLFNNEKELLPGVDFLLNGIQITFLPGRVPTRGSSLDALYSEGANAESPTPSPIRDLVELTAGSKSLASEKGNLSADSTSASQQKVRPSFTSELLEELLALEIAKSNMKVSTDEPPSNADRSLRYDALRMLDRRIRAQSRAELSSGRLYRRRKEKLANGVEGTGDGPVATVFEYLDSKRAGPVHGSREADLREGSLQEEGDESNTLRSIEMVSRILEAKRVPLPSDN